MGFHSARVRLSLNQSLTIWVATYRSVSSFPAQQRRDGEHPLAVHRAPAGAGAKFVSVTYGANSGTWDPLTR